MLDLCRHGICSGDRQGHQQDLSIGIVLRLAEKVRGNQPRIRAFIGNDQKLARAGRQVDRRAAREARHQPLGFSYPCISRATNLVDCRNSARAERQRCDRLRTADRPDFIKSRQFGCQGDQMIKATLRTRGRDDDELANARRSRGYRQHEKRRKERSLPARHIEPDTVDRPPCFCDGQSRRGFQREVGGKARSMKLPDLLGGELDSPDLLWVEPSPRRARHRADFDAPRLFAVDAGGDLRKSLPAARAHVSHDFVHPRLKGLVRPHLRTSERVTAASIADRVPVEPLHSIIFSIGTTRMADAPAPLSSCSVSQKTFSWQTACTAK